MIEHYLGDNELRVTALASGREIAGVMARETIDLLVLDLRLPGEDGMQIARKLREESAGLPIIMLTGRKDEADRVMGLELGADDYLTKPFSPRELLARIRALLRRTRSQQTVADGSVALPLRELLEHLSGVRLAGSVHTYIHKLQISLRPIDWRDIAYEGDDVCSIHDDVGGR